jgi:hypothetical protein
MVEVVVDLASIRSGRRRFASRLVLAVMSVVFTGAAMAFELNYDEFIPLDAEALAEVGMAKAYEELGPRLRKYCPAPARIQENVDAAAPAYSVAALGRDYVIYSGDDQEASWGRATFAFFDIVNRQLEGTGYGFYAINGGNDLGGMFLTPQQAEAARKTLPRKLDWPYLPTPEPPWYGQFHP